MQNQFLDPGGQRSAKPRTDGLTMMIDAGLPTAAFSDVVHSFAPHIDFVKFGWGTALVTPDLACKLAVCRELGVDFYFGGSLFERYVYAGRFSDFLGLLRDSGARHVEVSNGTIPLDQHHKAAYVSALSEEFVVLAEVGFKDVCRAAEMTPSEWVDAVNEDLDAGASLVITEARESGRSGIATPDGTLRGDVFDALCCEVPVSSLLFEAPTKELQVALIEALGPCVNLGNIAASDIIGVETLRLGLRGDTLLELAPSAPGWSRPLGTFYPRRPAMARRGPRKDRSHAIGA